MAWALDDRWLWLGFGKNHPSSIISALASNQLTASGALFYVAAKGIAYGLRDTLQLTEFDRPTDNAKPDHESHAEDCTMDCLDSVLLVPILTLYCLAIGLDSLRTLATSPNPDIANAFVLLTIARLVSFLTAMRVVPYLSSSPALLPRMPLVTS